MNSGPVPNAPSGRLISLDQFRGYTVAGMILVNFAGGYLALPEVIKHHNTYCSYADTIMPQFFFAVGFAFRLTYLRRRERDGMSAAIGHAISRNLGLLLFGIIYYTLDGEVKSWDSLVDLGPLGAIKQGFQREPFQTLVHIALTSLWVLPVIGGGVGTRVAWLVASAALFTWLSDRFYLEWAWTRPVIDGGPLAVLSWTIPLLLGSLAYDVVSSERASGEGWFRKAALRLATLGVVVMGVGYGMACLGATTSLDPSAETSGEARAELGRGEPGLAVPPFVKPEGRTINLWTMSQRTGSVSYLTFAAGFSLLVYAIFLVACDGLGWSLGVFRTFGTNALVAYVLHPMVFSTLKPYTPKDAPGWYVMASFGLAFGLCYLFVRHLESKKIYVTM